MQTLEDKLAALTEQLQEADLEIKQNKSEMQTLKKKEKILFQQVMDFQSENSELQDKVLKFQAYSEKVKEERNNYKVAWDAIDKKYVAAKS